MYATLNDARQVVGSYAESQNIKNFEDVVATVARQVFDGQVEDSEKIQALIEAAAN